MSCESCAAADSNPHTGRYQAGCVECQSRALAISPAFFDSKTAGKRTKEYQSALGAVGGRGNEESTHERVKEWAKRMSAAQKEKPA